MNTALPGHYAQEYITSVDCTLVNSEACSLVKHIWCFPKPQGSTEQSREKELLWIERAEKAKEAQPKTCSYRLDCVLHVLVPCLSTGSPVRVSQSFLGSPTAVLSFSVFSWDYDLYLPLQTEVTSQHSLLGGCGSRTELNP